ncbi:hypothetical protein BHE74_00027599 [Ensete ventricosum]|nr:hypothetical protein BHE74_00027599 [Ensete ventricosum]
MSVTSAVPIFGSRSQRVGSFEESLLSDLEEDLYPSGVERNIGWPRHGLLTSLYPPLWEPREWTPRGFTPGALMIFMFLRHQSLGNDSGSSVVAHFVVMLLSSKAGGLLGAMSLVVWFDRVGVNLGSLSKPQYRPWVWEVGPHNEVQVASIRGAPRWQSEVGVSECFGCNFDTGLSNLTGLFLQDKSSRVVGSQGGPSDDQVRVGSKGEFGVPYLGAGASSLLWLK